MLGILRNFKFRIKLRFVDSFYTSARFDISEGFDISIKIDISVIVHTRTSLGFLTSSRGTIRLLHREPGHCVRHAPRLDPRAGHGGAAPERAAPRPEQASLGKLDGTWDHEELYGEDEEARDDRISCEG